MVQDPSPLQPGLHGVRVLHVNVGAAGKWQLTCVWADRHSHGGTFTTACQTPSITCQATCSMVAGFLTTAGVATKRLHGRCVAFPQVAWGCEGLLLQPPAECACFVL